MQRAANALVAGGMIATMPNPDHKRAPLLVASNKGRALKAQADEIADGIAARLAEGMDMAAIANVADHLFEVRKNLEQRMRALDYP